jgi:hypothetical protein
MLDINPDDSSGKVLPIGFIVFFSFGWKAFLAGDHMILLVALITDTFVFKAKFTSYFFQIQVVLFHTSLKQKTHRCNAEMSNVYFCLTLMGRGKTP